MATAKWHDGETAPTGIEGAARMIPVSGDSGWYLDLYGRYLRDPQSVPADWRLQFEALDTTADATAAGSEPLARETIAAFRDHGHAEAQLDPLGLARPRSMGLLARMRAAVAERPDTPVRHVFAGLSRVATFGELLGDLERCYCGSVTLETAHLVNGDARDWIVAQYEAAMTAPLEPQAECDGVEAVALADAFETAVKAKFPTKKRFGIEGSEGSVVILRDILRQTAAAGIPEIVMGGIHRGRLATLATLLAKPLPTLLAEIAGHDLTGGGTGYTGDVPYHLGHAADLEIAGRTLHVALAPHPSHLTVVAPVAMGMARARRAMAQGTDAQVLPMCLMMHTDAAFSGQGLAAELLQLSGLSGYSVGGSVHIVVNNQIGFTTLPSEGRTARYCTDAAKMIGAPVLHVNGEDPAALTVAARVAFAWRQRMGGDVLIDMVCTRSNGHNELDEPRFTQPRTWAAIDARAPLAARLMAGLAASRPDEAERISDAAAQLRTAVGAAHDAIGSQRPNAAGDGFQRGWDGIADADEAALLARIPTGIAPAVLARLARTITTLPDGFDPHPKVARFHDDRRDSLLSPDGAVTFATAEALALASLLDGGISVRLSGQDSLRGTFTQRHLQVHDMGGDATTTPLAQAARGAARFEAHNSPLSEYAVLAFEYGHSLAIPQALTLWEAQFGDFLNGAQIVLDQFIASAEAKWRMRSGLVLLLPHGLEGQGPDHSSARVERILQLCANGNMVVANPSTPASLFHLLRRQIAAPWRKPLAVIAPKSLLRLRAACSAPSEFTGNTAFRPVIGESGPNPERMQRVVLCSGKIHYDLQAARAAAGLEAAVALVRLEQIYPPDMSAIRAEIARHDPQAALIWCQEEPANQGAWPFLRDRLLTEAPDLAARMRYAGRAALPVAAGGSIHRHESEQRGLVADALGITG